MNDQKVKATLGWLFLVFELEAKSPLSHFLIKN